MKDAWKTTILGKTFNVSVVDEIDGDDTIMGRCNPAQQRIRLRRDQAEDMLLETLLHEIVHACAEAVAVELEENDVIRLAASLYSCSALQVRRS